MTNVDTNIDTHHDGLNSLPIFISSFYTAWTTSLSPFTGCFVKIAFAMTVNSTNMSHNTIMFLSPTPANLPSTLSPPFKVSKWRERVRRRCPAYTKSYTYRAFRKTPDTLSLLQCGHGQPECLNRK